MASITLSVSAEFKSEINHFSWVNWSNVAQEVLQKKEIFERFLKTGTITDQDWEFCDALDWHPVDELPLKESFVKEIQSRKKEKAVRYKSVDEFFDKL
jgi:hypothetical protein